MPTAQVYQLCVKYHESAEELALILRSLKIYKKRKKEEKRNKDTCNPELRHAVGMNRARESKRRQTALRGIRFNSEDRGEKTERQLDSARGESEKRMPEGSSWEGIAQGIPKEAEVAA